MSLPKDAFQTNIEKELVKGWKGFIKNLEKSLDSLEAGLQEASKMRKVCTAEWCEATEHVIDELANSLFSVSEPRWAKEEDSKRFRALRKRLHDLYAEYRKTVS